MSEHNPFTLGDGPLEYPREKSHALAHYADCTEHTADLRSLRYAAQGLAGWCRDRLLDMTMAATPIPNPVGLSAAIVADHAAALVRIADDWDGADNAYDPHTQETLAYAWWLASNIVVWVNAEMASRGET